MHTSRILLIPALVASLAASAQDINEAYNLSNLTTQGTARSMGFGNALGSIGGDFSSLSVNPAGLGVYRTSELTLTPSLRINGAKTQYIGTTTTDNNTHFNINNFGIVFTDAPKGRRYDRRNWKAVSFAFGMNRTADFNRTYSYEGRNTNSSASQAFESDANQYPNDVYTQGTLAYMGYQSYLTDSTGPGQFQTIVPFQSGITQLKNVKETGRVNEYTLSLGGNYKEIIMLGATVGIPTVIYNRTSYYQETIPAGSTSANPGNFNSFVYNNSLKVTGSGLNLKLGAIYKVSDNVRLGASFHTPTIYNLTDEYSDGIVTTRNNTQHILSIDNGQVVGNRFDYSLITPWKAVASASFVLKDIGFVTVDYEYVDYKSMRYLYSDGIDNATGYTYQQEQDAINHDISKTYQGASNVRIGAEGIVTQYFMLRAGFGYYGNPYASNGYNSQRIDISGGLGFHFDNFFADIALVHSAYQGQELPYSIDFSHVISGNAAVIPVATTDFSINNVAVTFGVKF